MRIRNLVVSLALLTAALGGAACKSKPKAGGPCDAVPVGFALCQDATQALVCDKSGKLVPIRCGGKAGCYGTATGEVDAICDVSDNAAGEACPSAYANRGRCASDGKSLTLCTPSPSASGTGKFERIACKGPRGCEAGKGPDACDVNLAQAGDRCATGAIKRMQTCSMDLGKTLTCSGQPGEQTWVEGQLCSGIRRCVVDPEKDPVLVAECEVLHGIKTPCKTEGERVCSGDLSALLECKDGKYKLVHTCKGQQKCKASQAGDVNQVDCPAP